MLPFAWARIVVNYRSIHQITPMRGMTFVKSKQVIKINRPFAIGARFTNFYNAQNTFPRVRTVQLIFRFRTKNSFGIVRRLQSLDGGFRNQE
jgi:hypothetical protein